MGEMADAQPGVPNGGPRGGGFGRVRNGLLESHSLAPQKVVTIHNPVDRDRIERLSAEPLPPDWNPDERHIVAVGGWGRKGLLDAHRVRAHPVAAE